jgi:DNA-directed RNA polymerase subunit N (RpoN/RPB10)
MIIPVCCFTCGKEIASKWEPFQKMREEGVPIQEIWRKLSIKRWCCMRMLVSHVNTVDELLNFTRLQ